MKAKAQRTSGVRAGAGSLGVVLTFGTLAAVGLGWWLTAGSRGAGPEIDPDLVVEVERRDLIDGVNASGRVEPLARVAVMSRASGILREILVEEGDRVERGQVLAELDREQLEDQLREDRAQLTAAEARRAAAEGRLAEARVRVADPEIDFLEREVARLAELFQKGTVSLTEKEEAARALAVARFRVALVEASLPVLEASIAEAEAARAAAEAAVERGETALREATIQSPIDGVVLLREKEVGDGVSSILTAGGNATQIMTLGDLSSMHVEARVDEVDLGRIHVGMPALVTVDAHRGKALDGEVRRIAPGGTVDDNGIVTFQVLVTVQDPEEILKPDMTAEAKLVLGRRADVLSLPHRAFTRTEDSVWTVQRVAGEGEDASLETVEVELGLSDGLLTEIGSGLEEGDAVLLPEGLAGGR